jgi:hypothetical protein
MFSGFVSSFKGLMGWDLQVESGGQSEDEIKHSNNDERQSLFKQLSGFMGKDITSMISLPVWIFEPFSFLQVICEPMQFEELLNQVLQVFIFPDAIGKYKRRLRSPISILGCVRHRRIQLRHSFKYFPNIFLFLTTEKPFNPLLGETFEFIADRYKYFAEQVSHHPPIGVAEAKSDKYLLQFEMELKTKFSGNSTDVTVHGTNQFRTFKFNDYFTWGHLEYIEFLGIFSFLVPVHTMSSSEECG